MKPASFLSLVRFDKSHHFQTYWFQEMLIDTATTKRGVTEIWLYTQVQGFWCVHASFWCFDGNPETWWNEYRALKRALLIYLIVLMIGVYDLLHMSFCMNNLIMHIKQQYIGFLCFDGTKCICFDATRKLLDLNEGDLGTTPIFR